VRLRLHAVSLEVARLVGRSRGRQHDRAGGERDRDRPGEIDEAALAAR